MSCGGCGCCPKCGCRATCTCNRNIWSLESRDDFSYSGMKPVTDELDGDSDLSSQDSSFSVGGENGGKCGNCDCADGTCAKEGTWGANNGMRGENCGYANE